MKYAQESTEPSGINDMAIVLPGRHVLFDPVFHNESRCDALSAQEDGAVGRLGFS